MKKLTLLIVCLTTNILLFGQWTDNTAVNTLMGGDSPEYNLTAGGSNGNTYNVYWNHISGINYDLRLQILDPMGLPQFGESGSIISNTLPMSTFTQTSSLTIDADNNIYVGVTSTMDNIGHVFKLDSDGNNLWGPEGKNLGTGYTVKILPLSSGDVILSWFQGTGYIMKVDSDGNDVWTEPVGIEAYAPAQSFELSDGGNITIYHHKLSFGIYSVDYAQRFDSDGIAQWDEPLQLFGDEYNTAWNSEYSAAQDGDVIYYSYKLSHANRFDAYVQRINPDGTLPWGLQGSDFDTNETDFEQEIQIGFTPGSANIWALCRYTDSSQGQQGTYVQKFDKNTGERLFTDNAKEVFPLQDGGTSPTANLRLYNDQPIFLFMSGNDLNITQLDSIGDFAWPEESLPMATFDADKMRINFVKISENEFVATFLEDRGEGAKIYAQNFKFIPNGVDNIVANQNITFANPIQDRLELNSPSNIKSVVIYNTMGQMIYNLDKNQANRVVIDANNWTSGAYICVIATQDGVYQSIKVLKL